MTRTNQRDQSARELGRAFRRLEASRHGYAVALLDARASGLTLAEIGDIIGLTRAGVAYALKSLETRGPGAGDESQRIV